MQKGGGWRQKTALLERKKQGGTRSEIVSQFEIKLPGLGGEADLRDAGDRGARG